MTIVVALGTTSEQKLKYLEKELRGLGLDCDVKQIETPSGVSDQPMTDIETKKGSRNRARFAFEAVQGADMGLGVEVGYHPVDDDYDIFCWVTLVDRTGEFSSHKSEHIRLPQFHKEVIDKGGYLGDHVQQFIDEATDDGQKELGTIIKTREPFIREAIRKALASYFA